MHTLEKPLRPLLVDEAFNQQTRLEPLQGPSGN